MARSTKKKIPPAASGKAGKAKQRKAATAHSAAVNDSTRPARPLFRLIPLTMCMATGLLFLKSVEIYQSGRSLHQELLVSSVQAQAQPEAAATPPAAAPAATATAPAPSPAAPANTATAPAAAPADWVERRSAINNPREQEVLDRLSERRQRLEQLERDLELREKVLEATEQRIDQKIAELNTMSAELQELLVAYDTEEAAKIASLVKVYEAMKPKDAARIFDELNMDILLLVVDRMSERRVAPVLAAMSPQKAKELTEQLAEQQKSRPRALDGDEELRRSPPLM